MCQSLLLFLCLPVQTALHAPFVLTACTITSEFTRKLSTLLQLSEELMLPIELIFQTN